jgi:hypothetical protein
MLMMSTAFDVATAILAGTMAGNEFALAAFVHPQLERSTEATHAQMAPLLAAALGRAMPIWYGVALAFQLGAAFEHRPVSQGPGLLIALAALLWLATIVFTIAALVPINNRIAKMNPADPHTGWRADRARWDRLHRIRVALLMISVILLFTGLLQRR